MVIDQCLHGYADGHTLLATSTTLSREQRTLLSRMTDLSGPSPVSGFDGYLTAFPAPGDVYVLARTWYATELPRPGCVWTHSLLLDQAALRSPDIWNLVTLFQRPRQGERFEQYAARIEERPEAAVQLSVSRIHPLLPLIQASYDIRRSTKARVTVVTDTAAAVEDLFLAMWTQQWPELRRAFSFTTGMLGGLGGSVPFDLQAVPARNQTLAPEGGMEVIDLVHSGVHASDRWALLAAQDAVSRGELREFLWTFGGDFRDGRRAFRGLCETFTLLRGERARDLAAHVHSLFVDFAETEHLRQALFGGASKWALPENEVLPLVIEHNGAGFLECTPDEIRMRAGRLPITDLTEILKRALEERWSGSCPAALFDAFYAKCDVNSLDELPLSIVVEAIRLRPQLASDASLWGRSQDRARALLGALNKEGEIAQATIFGLLANGDITLLREAWRFSASAWIRGGLAYVDAVEPGVDIEAKLLEHLFAFRYDVPWELPPRLGRSLKYVSAVIELTEREANKFPISSATVFAGLPSLRDPHAELHACAFLLLVGLCRPEPTAARFLSAGFATVYRAAAMGGLPWQVWRRLEPLLPGHVREWDKCERLIEGTVSRFIHRRWPARDFLLTFREDETFDRAAQMLRAGVDAQRLDAFVAHALEDPAVATPYQRARILAWRADG